MKVGYQQTTLAMPSISRNETSPVSQCHRLWVSQKLNCCSLRALTHRQDPLNARFETCALPLIEASPGAIAALIILFRLFRIATRRVRSPEWTKPFVKEPSQAKSDLPSECKTYPSHSNALFFVSFIGLILQIAAISYPHVQLQDVSVITAWVCYCPLVKPFD
jgi:hypothetical protein